MGILSGPEIRRIVNRTRSFREDHQIPPLPWIGIDPFDPERLGPNSYDITLAEKLHVYLTESTVRETSYLNTRLPPGSEPFPYLDTRRENPTAEIVMDSYGYVLRPGMLYLGSTVERTVCAGVVPWLDGRSSVGRLGIQIHATAGRGDDGFGCDRSGGCSWTLEITVTHPVVVYAGLRIGQLTFFELVGDRSPYKGRYSQQDGPTASRLHMDAEEKQ